MKNLTTKKFAMWVSCQVEAITVARELRVYPLPVIPCKLKNKSRGQYLWYIGILLNISDYHAQRATASKVKEIARHETRHHWQLLHYPKYCWWMMHHGEVYMRYYHTDFNWMEADARAFADGKVEKNAAPPYSAKQMERWYQRGLI